MPTHYIVTPVRNAVRTIDATIWSVLSQAGEDLHIRYHIQDGGSTDGTLQRIQAWSTKAERMSGWLPSRVTLTYTSERDAGMYDAIVRGFASMAIPADAYMSWCNADDELWPGAIAAVARLAQDLPDVDWIMGWPAWYDDTGRFVAIERSPRYPQAILAAGLADGVHWPFIQQESTYWRKRLWDKAGGLNTSLKLAGDWDLWVRFARLTPLMHTHRQFGAFYVRPGQQSSDMTAYRSEMDRVIPPRERIRKLRSGVRHGASLTSIPWVVEGEQRRWEMATRFCRRRAAPIARVIGKYPVSGPLLTRLLHKLW